MTRIDWKALGIATALVIGTIALIAFGYMCKVVGIIVLALLCLAILACVIWVIYDCIKEDEK